MGVYDIDFDRVWCDVKTMTDAVVSSRIMDRVTRKEAIKVLKEIRDLADEAIVIMEERRVWISTSPPKEE